MLSQWEKDQGCNCEQQKDCGGENASWVRNPDAGTPASQLGWARFPEVTPPSAQLTEHSAQTVGRTPGSPGTLFPPTLTSWLGASTSILHKTQVTGHTPRSDTAGANPEQGLDEEPAKEPTLDTACLPASPDRGQQRPHPRDLRARAVPTGSAHGATGRQPRADAAQDVPGLVDLAHLHTSEGEMRNSQDHNSFQPKVLRCKTNTSFSFALRSSSKNGN